MKQNRRTFLRSTALISGAVAFQSSTVRGELASAVASSQIIASSEGVDGASLRRMFQSPPKKYRPLVRWWWPGNDVTDAELRREIDVLDKAGFGGGEIQAFFKGLPSKDPSDAQMQRINGFASESFFRHVRVAVEEARSRGMFIDYTFGSGWPFGGGEAITPELASIELRSTNLSVEGPATIRQKLQIPALTDGDPSRGDAFLKGLPIGWAERMRKRTKLVAVLAVRGENAAFDFHALGGPRQSVVRSGRLETDTSIDLTSQLEPDGTLHWDVPSGTWQIFVFCSVPTGQKVNAGAGAGPQLVMDHLSAEAFRAHAKRVGDDAVPILGDYFGNGLRAVFCDSLEVSANLFWSDDFIAEFRRRRGYDLTPYLPILKVQTRSEPFGMHVDLPIFEMEKIGDRVRNDYHQTVSDLMAERFYGEFNKWARQHKLLSRTQAHGAPADVLRIYGEADIPETEDLYDNGGYDFLKMAASSANVYGRRIVGSESFVWPNAAYQTTPEKMKLAADELLTAGVNAIVYHGFPYIIPEIPAPGWHPFTGFYGEGNFSSQFNELNPLWPFVSKMNDYIARVQLISQLGSSVAAVALYRNDLAHGAEEMPPAPKLNQALMDAGYNYDHINADSLARCEMNDRMLATAGGARYRILVLPALDAIDVALAEKLQGFAAAGLPIFFAGKVPTNAEKLLDHVRNTQRVKNAIESLRNFSNVHFASDAGEAVSMLGQAASPDVRFHSAPLSFIQLRLGRIKIFFLRNSADAACHLHAEFDAEGSPELWDPWTGGTEAAVTKSCRSSVLTSYRRKGTLVEVEIDFEPFASALIVFDPDRAAPPSWAATDVAQKLRRAEIVGSTGWKLAAAGMRADGETSTIRRDLPALVDWSLDDGELRGFSGRAVYSTALKVTAADAGSRFQLDLGNVRDVAEVSINGKPAGTLLLRPYRLDITAFLHPGDNQLEVAVTNTLFNFMVLRNPRPFRAGPTENLSGLMSAGLIGPVQLKIMD